MLLTLLHSMGEFIVHTQTFAGLHSNNVNCIFKIAVFCASFDTISDLYFLA